MTYAELESIITDLYGDAYSDGNNDWGWDVSRIEKCVEKLSVLVPDPKPNTELVQRLNTLADDLDARRLMAAAGRPPAEQSVEDRLWANYMYGQAIALRHVVRWLT